MPNQPNFFEERYTKYFPLLKAKFPDYDKYKDLEYEPSGKTKKMKYYFAQFLKNIEESATIWGHKKNYELDAANFIHLQEEKYSNIVTFMTAYEEAAQGNSGEKNRLHLTQALKSAFLIQRDILLEMKRFLPDPSKNKVGKESLNEIESSAKKNMLQDVKESMAQQPAADKNEEQSYFRRLYNEMKDSYDHVLWNSAEYKAMFHALETFKDGIPQDLDTNVRNLLQATQNYIDLKKDIPFTDNGKIRLTMARELLDGAQALQDGLDAEKELQPAVEQQRARSASLSLPGRQASPENRKPPLSRNDYNTKLSNMARAFPGNEKTSDYDQAILQAQKQCSQYLFGKNADTQAFEGEFASLMLHIVARKKFLEEGTELFPADGYPTGAQMQQMKAKTAPYLKDAGTQEKLFELLLEGPQALYADYMAFQKKELRTKNESIESSGPGIKTKLRLEPPDGKAPIPRQNADPEKGKLIK